MGKIEDYQYFLRIVANSTSAAQRRCLLKYASRMEILALSEVVANYLNGFIQISQDNFPLFLKHKRLFRIIGFAGRKSWIKCKQAAIDLGKVLSVFLKDALRILLQ